MARALIRVSGDDPRKFLQGLVSNDVKKLSHGHLLYAALLTPQGKYLADFFLFADGDDVLIDVAEGLAGELMTRLNMYKLRAQITIERADIPVSRGSGPAPAGAMQDPRHSALGWRLYGQALPEDDTDWDALHVALCIPQSGIELTPDVFILEAGFERLNGVDFRKGCYVGQEVTARMQHKTDLRKGFVTVGVNGSAPIGTQIFTSDKIAGTLFTQSQGKAMAYLRFDRATAQMQAGSAQVYWPLPSA